MLLVKQYEIKKSSNIDVHNMLDNFCFLSKNLYNLTNYYIRQCYFITRKLSKGEILDSREKAFLKNLNEVSTVTGSIGVGLCHYNCYK